MRIYVASSWRNECQPHVVAQLRAAGHDVYDFRNPLPGNNGFNWREIDPDWQSWTAEQFRAALEHPIATHGLGLDVAALERAEATVLVMPCGRSAHLEAGYALGRGQRVYVLLAGPSEPELLYGLAHYIATSIDEVIERLAS